MEITDVRIRLVKESTDRLKAVCSVTLEDQFVVRDVKIVEGSNGLFVAMPSRKLSAPCPQCRTQNNVRAKYCNECGQKLPPPRIPADADGREKAHRDIAHPITPGFRQAIQERVLEVYRVECERSGHPDPDVSDDAPVAAEEKRSEYDELIAGLKPGGEGRAERGGRTEFGGGPSSRDRHGRGDGRGRREREERPAEVSERHEAAEVAQPVTSGDDSEGEREDDSYSPATKEEPASAPTMDRDAQPPAEEPSRDDEGAEKPPPADDEARDDSAPFGAGIL